MNILIDIGHPADFLLYKEFAFVMQSKGNRLFFTTRKKDVALDLIVRCGFEYKCFGRNYRNIIGKIIGIAKFDFQLLLTSIRFRPDVFLSAGSIYASHVSCILRKPHIVCEDTGNLEQIRLYRPFASVILTSDSFKKRLGSKQIFYRGYHELAYLHPNYFCPEKDRILSLFRAKVQDYVIVRFVSWSASHDIGLKGISLNEKIKLVRELSQYARVYISSEQELPRDLKEYRLPIHPSDLHHALSFASLVIGEGATVAAEAAVLGTPAIYINAQSLGYLEEMERCGLVRIYDHFSDEIINEAKLIILDKEKKAKLKVVRQRLLAEKIDVTAFLVWFVGSFPLSLEIMTENPEYQARFE